MPPGFDASKGDIFFFTWFQLAPNQWPRFVDFGFVNNQIQWYDTYSTSYGKAYLNVVSFR
ncbi:hypothetical protein JMUB7544_25870 [Staphylococcus aureus]